MKIARPEPTGGGIPRRCGKRLLRWRWNHAWKKLLRFSA